MKRFKFLLIALILAMPSVADAVEPYVGVKIGILEGVEKYSPHFNMTDSNGDNSDTDGMGAKVGLKINQYFAVELEHIVGGTVREVEFEQPPGTEEYNLESDYSHNAIYLVGFYNFTEKAYVYGKLGYLESEWTLDVTNRNTSAFVASVEAEDDTVAIGLGLGYQFNSLYSMELSYSEAGSDAYGNDFTHMSVDLTFTF